MTLSETGAARQAGHFCVPHLAAHLWIDAPSPQPPPAAISRPLLAFSWPKLQPTLQPSAARGCKAASTAQAAGRWIMCRA